MVLHRDMREPAEITVGCDPGASSGIACMQGRKLVYAAQITTGTLDPKKKWEALKAALRALHLPLDSRGRIVGRRVWFVAENQFMGQSASKGKAKNWFCSSVSVVRNAAVWQAMAELCGMNVRDPVYPATWQAAFGLASRQKGNQGRGWIARNAAMIVGAKFGDLLDGTAVQADVDVHAAILIAVYGQMLHLGWGGRRTVEPAGFEWVRQERTSRQKKKPSGQGKRKVKRKVKK